MVVVIDFGSQTTQLIARLIRELGVYCEIHPFDVERSTIETKTVDAWVLSGGPESVTERITPRCPAWVFESKNPILGICYGMQTLIEQHGGSVKPSQVREFGAAEVNVIREDALLHDLGSKLPVWMSHGDHVVDLPNGFEQTAKTDSIPIVGCCNEAKQWYGVQFHPEVTHTRDGREIMRRFLFEVSDVEANWDSDHIVAEHVERIRDQVGDEEVVLGLSGGVDSSVTAALLSRAIGERLHCIFVDNGLLRAGETQQVKDAFSSSNVLPVDLHVVEAQDRFLSKLNGIEDPEEKRKIIGEEFVRVFEESARQLNNVKWLAQGTIYPDVVESAANRFGKSHVIKSHHNVGGLPEKLHLKVLEPLRDLFKDEVRKLGLELGLPNSLIGRHPFPGPGLAVRVLGAVKEEYLDTLRAADKIFINELIKQNWYDKVAQAFCVFMPIKTVGVVGDARTYQYVIALRAVTTTDFMTADWANLPHDLIGRVSTRIINEVSTVSRVVYDISSKPPATVEWE